MIEELNTVFEKPVAEKLGQVMLSVYERLHESLVLQGLDVLESAELTTWRMSGVAHMLNSPSG